MRKVLSVLLTLTVLISFLLFLAYKSMCVKKDMELAKESAIRMVESEYPGKEFFVTGIVANKGEYYMDYGVTLRVVGKETVIIRCSVKTAKMVDGYYPAIIVGTTNIEYIE